MIENWQGKTCFFPANSAMLTAKHGKQEGKKRNENPLSGLRPQPISSGL
jgi:hypothetical protein